MVIKHCYNITASQHDRTLQLYHSQYYSTVHDNTSQYCHKLCLISQQYLKSVQQTIMTIQQYNNTLVSRFSGVIKTTLEGLKIVLSNFVTPCRCPLVSVIIITSLTTSRLDGVCDNRDRSLSLPLLVVDPLVSSIHWSVVLELG